MLKDKTNIHMAVIDDDESILKVFSSLMKQFSYRADFFSNPKQAYDKIVAKRDTWVRIKYFNFLHFAFDNILFADYQKKAALEPQDFFHIDRDIHLKTELLHKKEPVYQEFVRIMDGLTGMRYCKYSAAILVMLALWLITLLIIP